MTVQLIATYQCGHRADLARELTQLGVPFELVFIEEHPHLIARYQIRHSPNLVIDGQVVCRGQPTDAQMHELFMKSR